MTSSGSKRFLSPEGRLIVLVIVSITAILVDNIPTLGVLYATTLTGFLATKPRPRNAVFLFLISIAAVWGFIITQSFFYPYRPRTELLRIIPPDLPVLGALTGGVSLYLEGILYGTAQSLRFLTMMTAGMTVVWTTSAQELLAGFRRLRLPYNIAFMLATAVRFIPAIAREARTVLAAMRMRGFALRPSRPWNYIRALGRGLAPILHRNIRRAGMLADSVECKGFAMARNGSRSAVADERTEARRAMPEWFVMTGCLLALLALVAAKGLLWAAQWDLLYIDNLRWLYEFSRLYL